MSVHSLKNYWDSLSGESLSLLLAFYYNPDIIFDLSHTGLRPSAQFNAAVAPLVDAGVIMRLMVLSPCKKHYNLGYSRVFEAKFPPFELLLAKAEVEIEPAEPVDLNCHYCHGTNTALWAADVFSFGDDFSIKRPCDCTTGMKNVTSSAPELDLVLEAPHDEPSEAPCEELHHPQQSTEALPANDNRRVR